MKNKLINFYKAEKALMNKSDDFMRKIYINRVKANLEGEREVIIFIIDDLGEKFFSKKLTDAYINKLTYGFKLLTGEKELEEAILNHLEYRKANLK